jgi:hypothetical protein
MMLHLLPKNIPLGSMWVFFSFCSEAVIMFFILSGSLSNILGRNQQINHLKTTFKRFMRIYVPSFILRILLYNLKAV